MHSKKIFFLAAIFLGILIAADALCQNSSLRGKVVWASGAPAVGLEIKLNQNNRVIATTYTNDRGLYAFFNINIPSDEMVIVVADRNRILKEQPLSDNGSTSIIPDIVLE